jgi:hypothetical protein
MQPAQRKINESKLLGITIPAIQEIIYILLPIMKEYDIPKIVLGNEKNSKIVLA